MFNDLFAYINIDNKEKLIKHLKEECSGEILKYIEYANKLINNEINIFEKFHKFRNKIDWHHSFFKNFRWKLDRSENIERRPRNRNVDVKYVWELNRHQFFTYLG